MLPAGLALLAGLDAALLLLGLPAPVTTDRLPIVHGMLLVIGFVGTLVALERATALARWYGFLAPGLLGAGAIALLLEPVPLVVGKAMLVAGTAAFTVLYVPLWRRQHDDALLTQLAGAGLACAGAVRWLVGAPFDQVLPWLIGFVVLTIAAERVELARITLGASAGRRILLHGAGVVLALLIGLVAPDLGAVALGVALLAMVLWLVRHDVARRTIRTAGATRYMAAAILAGYGWLLVASALLLVGAPQGSAYDAVVHAVFLGYTMSMIMAHATTILPAVLRIALPYRPAFWVPLGLLQLSLLIRLWLGDALGWSPAWEIGGVLGVIALLVFVLTALTSAILGPPRPRERERERERTATRRSDEASRLGGRRAGAIAGAALLVCVVASALVGIPGVGIPGVGGTADGTVAVSDAPVQRVTVEAADMRFTPSTITVEPGTHLIIEVANTDAAQTHDLVLATGQSTGRLAPGATAELDAGVITAGTEGWCSVAGHRQHGMVLQIVVGDAEAGQAEATDHAGHSDMDSDADMDSGASLESAAYDAVLEPLPEADGPTTREVTLEIIEQTMEVAPGRTQTVWTFAGSVPGPVLHGRVGDTFVVTLINSGTMGHSIDFHAGSLAPDEPMRTIAPGESLVYTFTADRAGIWMYHCATMPMSTHIAAGMYGAVVIEPEDLPEVDRSYVLVQGEHYLSDETDETDGAGEVDADAVAAGEPDLVVFNGRANQYDEEPLTAVAGERVRFWVLDAGIERASSFHVIGGQFDTVWSEGAYLLERSEDSGSQALALQPAQGGFVELVLPEEGTYPFVSHLMRDAERGAHGLLEVSSSGGEGG
ncbi:multicopper oxidase domain-containing protein [Brachybacterium sp. DNPG3]